MPDAPATPPGKPPAKSGRIGPFPLWVWIVGVGGVALFFYHQRSAGGQAQTQTPLVGGVVTDPNTGFPVDPTTGLPYITSQPGSVSQTLDQWIKLAAAALTNAGVAPGSANSALYDYSQGNPLSPDEANIVNKALGLVGFPPITLPFFGTVPKTGTTGPSKLPFITADQYKKSNAAARSQWIPYTTEGGAHGYIPKAPAGASPTNPVIVQIGSRLIEYLGGNLYKVLGTPPTANPIINPTGGQPAAQAA